VGSLTFWPEAPCETAIEPIALVNYGMYVRVKCGFPWGLVVVSAVLLCCCGGGCFLKRRKSGPARWGPQNSLQQPFRDSMF
jgi:hypothetical protein